MAKTCTCRNVGVDCDWKARGGRMDEVISAIRVHAREAHNLVDIPAELEAAAMAAIRDER